MNGKNDRRRPRDRYDDENGRNLIGLRMRSCFPVIKFVFHAKVIHGTKIFKTYFNKIYDYNKK